MSKTVLKILAIILLCVVFQAKGTAQSAPKAEVHVEVHLRGGIYQYQYSVVTASQSPPIDSIELDISLSSGYATLSSDGLTNDGGFLSTSSAAVTSDTSHTPMVPVGFTTPDDWSAGITVAGTALWFANQGTSEVTGGGTISGFGLDTYGLPTLRQIQIETPIDFENLPFSPPADPGDLLRYEADLDAYEAANTSRATTIGPTAPPTNFQPISFLQTLQSYKEQSIQQGWITDSGIAISLDAKLNAAQQALQNGDTTTAKNVLNAFINEVQAQTDKHLTSEAVALLQLNAQYLVSQLL